MSGIVDNLGSGGLPPGMWRLAANLSGIALIFASFTAVGAYVLHEASNGRAEVKSDLALYREQQRSDREMARAEIERLHKIIDINHKLLNEHDIAILETLRVCVENHKSTQQNQAKIIQVLEELKTLRKGVENKK